ncbi:NAD(P)H-binding protein [Sciscionella marina]|uniref:NAD(P)H-binding protein n=1 Tax=Sciscionella marina TaxID=508770 RepID=UPI00037DC703|nr:NAD(P)H-binding protein [Sciscionella marina]
MKLVVTGATGKLGRAVVAELLRLVPAERVTAVVRDEAKAADLAAQGVPIRMADYTRPDTLAEVFGPGDRVLFVSTNVPGAERMAQHAAVIEAAKAAEVGLLAYTSVLDAPNAGFSIGRDHWATEQLITATGLPSVMLRNGWYNENYTGFLGPTMQAGRVFGAAGDGRVATAAVADYAMAAAIVLTADDGLRPVYELSGDTAWSLAEFAAELSAQTGADIAYDSMEPAQYKAIMLDAGVPEASADALLEADAAIARGELSATPGDLRRLIGRPTTTIAASVTSTLAAGYPLGGAHDSPSPQHESNHRGA